VRKLSSILILSLVSLTGCAESYSVYVNGFAETAKPIPENARIYVSVDPNSDNPIFDNEIKVKIVKLLASRGFVPIDDVKSEYHLTFRFGVMSYQEEDYEYFGAGLGMYGRRSGLDTAYYIPAIRTVWDQWLQIKVYRSDAVVWVGEAVTSKSCADKRKSVEYLLVAVFEYFGQDTVSRKSLTISEKDPRITGLGVYAE
jgi:hypothetical protein